MVKNDIERALDDKNAVFLVMLDLSAAFDTIGHDIPMQHLEHGFGIKGTALNWFHSYITGRHFRISVGSNMSEEFILECYVPQGSAIGSRVFSMYSHNYVSSKIIRHGLNYHIYADDVKIYMSFDPMCLVMQHVPSLR